MTTEIARMKAEILSHVGITFGDDTLISELLTSDFDTTQVLVKHAVRSLERRAAALEQSTLESGAMLGEFEICYCFTRHGLAPRLV